MSDAKYIWREKWSIGKKMHLIKRGVQSFGNTALCGAQRCDFDPVGGLKCKRCLRLIEKANNQ